MVFKRSFALTLLISIIVTAAFFTGYQSHARQVESPGLPVLFEAYELLTAYGLKEPPAEPALEYGMIRGMLQAYSEPYTSFFEPAQHELSSNSLQGSFGGIGASLTKDSEEFFILLPYPDGPAARAGILDGDRIISVDKLPVTPEMDREMVEAALSGKVGSRTYLVFARPPDYTTHEASIERVEIALPSVTWYLAPGEARLGVIKVNLIAATSKDEIQRAVNDLQKRGAQAFALDLRDNYGGLLTSGIEIARLFLKEGTIIEQQYKGKPVEQYRVDKPGPLVDIAIVVLVNHNTASAAEIVAGALKAHDRAILIGSATYGKDTIQLVYELSDHSSMHITAAQWWVPGLEPAIGKGGLQPDIIVSDENTTGDPILQAAIQSLFVP